MFLECKHSIKICKAVSILTFAAQRGMGVTQNPKGRGNRLYELVQMFSMIDSFFSMQCMTLEKQCHKNYLLQFLLTNFSKWEETRTIKKLCPVSCPNISAERPYFAIYTNNKLKRLSLLSFLVQEQLNMITLNQDMGKRRSILYTIQHFRDRQNRFLQ